MLPSAAGISQAMLNPRDMGNANPRDMGNANPRDMGNANPRDMGNANPRDMDILLRGTFGPPLCGKEL
jgi:hypothetical protein